MGNEGLAAELAGKIKRWNLSTPAIFFLEGNRPFGFVFGQGLLLLEPLATLLLGAGRWHEMALFFEEDANLELLLEALESEGQTPSHLSPPHARTG